MNEERHYLSTREAAEYLGLSARTLDRYRVSGEGPVFHRFGGAGALHPRRPRRLGEGAAPGVDRRRRLGARRGEAVRRGAAALGLAALGAGALMLGAEAAYATTDTTFGDPLDTVQDIVGGTGGQLAAALAVGAALVGSVLRFNAMQLMGAVGVGIAAGAGTGIVTGLVGTAIV